jgi:hypothetical protein
VIYPVGDTDGDTSEKIGDHGNSRGSIPTSSANNARLPAKAPVPNGPEDSVAYLVVSIEIVVNRVMCRTLQ